MRVCVCVHASWKCQCWKCLSECLLKGLLMWMWRPFLWQQRYLRVCTDVPWLVLPLFVLSSHAKTTTLHKGRLKAERKDWKIIIIIIITLAFSVPAICRVLFVLVCFFLQSLMLQTQLHQRLPRRTPYRNPVPVPPTKVGSDPRFQEALVSN